MHGRRYCNLPPADATSYDPGAASHVKGIESEESYGVRMKSLLMAGVLGMQELQYLNIAINNITRIENLHRCESLTRLDMTMNFVDTSALGSIDNLRGLIFLRELHLLGNPCTQWSRYREYVSAMLPQLQLLVRHVLKAYAWMLVCLPH